jgi:hypothetical protein
MGFMLFLKMNTDTNQGVLNFPSSTTLLLLEVHAYRSGVSLPPNAEEDPLRTRMLADKCYRINIANIKNCKQKDTEGIYTPCFLS